MNIFRKSKGIAAMATAALALTVLIPSAASASEEPDLSPTSSQIERDENAVLLEVEDVEVTDEGIRYGFPGEPTDLTGAEGDVEARGIFNAGTTCVGDPTMRKTSNGIEWNVQNQCSKKPASQYLPWFIKAGLQRSVVGANSWSLVQGWFWSPDQWDHVENLGNTFSCLGTTNYDYRVVFSVNYNGITTPTWYSDKVKFGCA